MNPIEKLDSSPQPSHRSRRRGRRGRGRRFLYIIFIACLSTNPVGTRSTASELLMRENPDAVERVPTTGFMGSRRENLFRGILSPRHAAEASRDETWERIAPFFSPPAKFAGDFGTYKSPLILEDGRKVISRDQWSKRRLEILAKWTGQLGEWPPLIEKPRIEFIEKEKRENFAQHRVRIELAPQQIEEAFLLIPDGTGPFPAVIVPFYEAKTSIGRGSALLDFGYQLTKRGFVTLSIGSPGGSARDPATGAARCQPLSFLAYIASNCRNAVAGLPEVDRNRIGIVGHSYGGKWAMFAACLDEKFACAVWSDPGIVFDETRPNVNYWEPWYLGFDQDKKRNEGVPTQTNPRTGPYKDLFEGGSDLHELHALMAPRAFLVSGGS